jgi:hypothetical protein
LQNRHPVAASVVSNFIVQDQAITYREDGSQTRSFRYVDDLIDRLRESEAALTGSISRGDPVDYRLHATTARYRLFTEEACQLIAEASHGKPRTINILCDTALVYGFAANVSQIDADLVSQVIEHKAEYGVLPVPGRVSGYGG